MPAMSNVPSMGVLWLHMSPCNVAMCRGVRRVTSAVLLMCQRNGGLLLSLVATEGALALTVVSAGKTGKETAASKCFICLLHDLYVCRSIFCFFRQKYVAVCCIDCAAS